MEAIGFITSPQNLKTDGKSIQAFANPPYGLLCADEGHITQVGIFVFFLSFFFFLPERGRLNLGHS